MAFVSFQCSFDTGKKMCLWYGAHFICEALLWLGCCIPQIPASFLTSLPQDFTVEFIYTIKHCVVYRPNLHSGQERIFSCRVANVTSGKVEKCDWTNNSAYCAGFHPWADLSAFGVQAAWTISNVKNVFVTHCTMTLLIYVSVNITKMLRL